MDSDSILEGPVLGCADTMDGIPDLPVTNFEELDDGNGRKGCFLL